MKSFLTTTRDYWQIRLDAITSMCHLSMVTLRALRSDIRIMLRQPLFYGTDIQHARNRLKSYQNDLCALRAARTAARDALRQLRQAA